MSRQGNQRNDSSGVKAALTYDQDSGCNKEKDVHERKEESKEKHNQAGCSSHTSHTSHTSSSAPYSSRAPSQMSRQDHHHDSSKKARQDHSSEKSDRAGCSSPSTSSFSSSKMSNKEKNERPLQMSKWDNESPDNKDLIDFGQKSERVEKEKHEREREDVSEENLSQAGSSSFPSYSSSPSSFIGEAASGRQAERDELMKYWCEDAASSCCQLDDLKPLPKCTNQLGNLKLSWEHTILVNVGFLNCEGKLVPQEGKDIWSSDVVKMPCSRSSIMEIKTGVLKKLTKVRRWDVITRQLEGLSKMTNVSVREVEEAIMKYNPKYSGQWSFDALSAFVKSVPTMENYFHSLVPKIAALALKLPEYVRKAIPLLRKKKPAKITLSQVQISCLLANAFFCTFPHRNTTHSKAEYHDFPTINFSSLFGNGSERKKQKLRAIMHYFKAVTDESTKPEGLVTFERRCLQDTNISDWRSCTDTMSKLHVTSQGTIETEGTGMLQVDFASSWIGGGVLGSGLVQEEILFLINPELIVSRLFTEKLEDNECLIITGSQQFSCHTGFGDSFEWAGPHDERLPRDEWKRLKRQILVIDALYFRHRMEQYSMSKVMRELNKAYCGFKSHEDDEPDIATGKWGCGAFNGDPQLKAVIQLMAAARAKRGLAFFTFEDKQLERDLQQIYHLLVMKGTTVGKLFGILQEFCVSQQKPDGPHSLFELIRNTIGPTSLL